MNQIEKSETPLTDAAMKYCFSNDNEFVTVDFARTLERRLTALEVVATRQREALVCVVSNFTRIKGHVFTEAAFTQDERDLIQGAAELTPQSVADKLALLQKRIDEHTEAWKNGEAQLIARAEKAECELVEAERLINEAGTRREEAERESAAAQTQLGAWHGMFGTSQLTHAIAARDALQKQLATAREDSARLDWLESRKHEKEEPELDQQWTEWFLQNDRHGIDIRAAIDAARNSEGAK